MIKFFIALFCAGLASPTWAQTIKISNAKVTSSGTPATTKPLKDWAAEIVTHDNQLLGGAGTTIGAGLVTATGSTTARPLANITADLPLMSRPGAPNAIVARGATAARAVGLRAIMRNRATFGAVAGVGPGGGYSALWIRDYYMMATTYPGYFTSLALRPVVDAFVAGIGGWSGTNYAPERIEMNGSLTYKPGVAPGTGQYPAFDNGPYLALLTRLAAERGDRTVFATHGAQIALALAATPRDASGLVYSDPLVPSIGWGFEDGIQLTGGLGMATALHAHAYRAMMDMALAAGDVGAASVYASTYRTLMNALRTLKRSDGFYNASTTETRPHVILTALIVAEHLCSDTEARDSATALAAAYRAGRISRRGSIRHLLAPNYWSVAYTSMAQDTYQNGGYWLGQWVGWAARAISLVDAGSAALLMQEAVDEMHREHRIAGDGPHEWTFGASGGASLYGASTGFLADAFDPLDAAEFSLGGATGSQAIYFAPHGVSLTQIEVLTPTASTATIQVFAASRSAAASDDPLFGGPLTFGAEQLVGYVSLSSAVGGATRSRLLAPVPSGGYVRAVVLSGSSTQPFRVRLLQSPVVAALGSPPVLYSDDFATNRLAADYTTTGTWTVSGGVLSSNTAAAAQVAVVNAAAVYNQSVSVRLTSADFGARYPEVVVRYVDDNNMIFALVSPSAVNVYERVGGVNTLLGSIGGLTLVNGTYYTVTLSVTGPTVSATVTGGIPSSWTTSLITAGKAGVRVELASATLVSFDDLSITEPAQPIPPGYVLEYGGSTGLVTGEAYTAATGTTNLRYATGDVALTTTTAAPAVNY